MEGFTFKIVDTNLKELLMKLANILSKSSWAVMFSAALLVTGCDNDEFEPLTVDLSKEVKITEFAIVGATSVAIDEKTKTITVVFPGGSNVSAIVPDFTVSSGATVTPNPGTALDLRIPQTFTVKNGNLYSTYKIEASVLAVTAFLSHHESVNDITDDDEKAYAEWFFSNYEDDLAEFVSFADIKSGAVDLSKFKTLTWYLDGNADEVFSMPAIATDVDVVDKVKNFYLNGGNLYLLGYAGRYLIELGRFPDGKYFVEVGNGPGFDNGDTWGIGTSILQRDESSHPIYSGIPLTINGTRKTFPVIGPGWKENHNYVVVRIPEVYGMANDNVVAYDKFNDDNATRWLGVWDGIGDYFMAGVIEFEPKGDYQGRAVFQGIGGIEWDQNAKGTINAAGTNPYQANIELLAKNTISYLALN